MRKYWHHAFLLDIPQSTNHLKLHVLIIYSVREYVGCYKPLLPSRKWRYKWNRNRPSGDQTNRIVMSCNISFLGYRTSLRAAYAQYGLLDFFSHCQSPYNLTHGARSSFHQEQISLRSWCYRAAVSTNSISVPSSQPQLRNTQFAPSNQMIPTA